MKLSNQRLQKAAHGVLYGAVASFLATAALAQTNPTPVPPPPTPAVIVSKAPTAPWISEVTKMADAGVGQDVIEAYVKNTPSASNISVDDILYLKGHNISDGVIAAMIQHGANAQQAAAAVAQYQYQQSQYPATQAPAQSYTPAATDQTTTATSPAPVYVVNNQSYPSYSYPYSYPYYSYPYYYPSVSVGFGFPLFFGSPFFCGNRFFFHSGFHGGFVGFHSGSVGGFHSGGVHVAAFGGGFHGGRH